MKKRGVEGRLLRESESIALAKRGRRKEKECEKKKKHKDKEDVASRTDNSSVVVHVN